MDYAYTLQGWLKGVNGIIQTAATDMGQDGLSTNATRKWVGRDQYGYVLNYYNNDYKAAGTTSFDPDVTAVTKSAYYNSAQELFNGNIRSMTVAIKQFGNAQGYAYGYDQLNRIRKLDTWNSITAGAAPSAWTIKTNYQERVTYDPNGNIKTYTRNQQAGTLMDNLTYSYYAGTNRLQRVNDAVAANVATTDIDDQLIGTNGGNNYLYDGSGNLVKDTSEALTVTWSPYGKVLSAVRKRTVAPAVDIQTLYGYDPMQNRVLKTYINGTDTTKTYYIRDAQGNTMSVYTRRKDTLVWAELHLYGSSRLGTYEPNQRLTPSVDSSKKWQLRDGQKRYELTNHLGNVLVTINDRKQGFQFAAGAYAYFEAVVIQATDYYPFGLEMPGRTFQAANTTAFRYGFNGQEKDLEIGSAYYTAEFWEYDTRIGRRWNVDPEWKKFASLSPYAVNLDNPVAYTDPKGDCPNCISGFIIAGLLDISFQVGEHMIKGDNLKSALRKVDWIQVGTSATVGGIMGAFTGGFDKLGKAIGDPTKRKVLLFVAENAIEALFDYGISKGLDVSGARSKIYGMLGYQDIGDTQVEKKARDAVENQLKDKYPNAEILEEVYGKFKGGGGTYFDFLVLDRKSGEILEAAESKTAKSTMSNPQKKYYEAGMEVTLSGKNAKAYDIEGKKVNPRKVQSNIYRVDVNRFTGTSKSVNKIFSKFLKRA